MAPNMKATERLDDVEHKLRDAEGEADTAKKESKAARDRFNDVKRRRSGARLFFMIVILHSHAGPSYSRKRLSISPNVSIECTKTSPKAKLPPWAEWLT
jgi:hypothetical protein